jgi:hypothetical protein
VILGLIDVRSRKFMHWSMQGLIHISNQRIHLFPGDLNQEETDRRNQISLSPMRKVLGQPMPALFPMILDTFLNDVLDDYDRLKLINQYTVGPEYVNIMHYLSMNNKGDLIRQVIK